MVQSNKYYKSRAVGVTSEVGLTTDREFSVLPVLKKHNVFYSSEISEVTWYEPPPKNFNMSVWHHIFVFWDLFPYFQSGYVFFLSYDFVVLVPAWVSQICHKWRTWVLQLVPLCLGYIFFIWLICLRTFHLGCFIMYIILPIFFSIMPSNQVASPKW